MACANASEDCTAKRGPYSAVNRLASPTVTVRGVACTISWPSLKSSKKLPVTVLSIFWSCVSFISALWAWTKGPEFAWPALSPLGRLGAGLGSAREQEPLIEPADADQHRTEAKERERPVNAGQVRQ